MTSFDHFWPKTLRGTFPHAGWELVVNGRPVFLVFVLPSDYSGTTHALLRYYSCTKKGPPAGTIVVQSNTMVVQGWSNLAIIFSG